MKRIRITIDHVPYVLYLGFKKMIGTEPQRPTSFIFFGPEEEPNNGHYSLSMLKASEMMKVSEQLLGVVPIEFDFKLSAKVDWQELYETRYGRQPGYIKKIAEILKQGTLRNRQLKAAADDVVKKALEEAESPSPKRKTKKKPAKTVLKKKSRKAPVKKVIAKKKKARR